MSDDGIIFVNLLKHLPNSIVMIQKIAKQSTFFSRFKTGVKIVVALETAAFLGSYYVWYRMNRDQGKIFKMHDLFFLKSFTICSMNTAFAIVEWDVYVGLVVFHFG